MHPRFIRLFIFSAGVLLLLTAIAKLISAYGGAQILQSQDPILRTSFKQVFLFVGVLEMLIAVICLFSRRLELQAGLVAWLATTIVAYRFGLVWIGYQKSCSCLGNLTDALHIPPQTADMAMKIILAYLLIGSYGILFRQWWKNRKSEAG